MKNCIIASTSTLYGGDYLEYILSELKEHFKNCKDILFIPYARPSGITHDEYTQKVSTAFAKIDIKVNGIHEFDDPIEAIINTKGIFIGGGNTFLLVSELYKNKVMTVLANTIKNGTPYIGTSAGSNICGLTMQTTNDMPISYPPSFDTLGIIPFNLNPHFLDEDEQSQHMGETRATRIKEFHKFNSQPVLGLREGSWLDIKGNDIILKGKLTARLFEQNKNAVELQSGSNLNFLEY